MQIEKPSQGTSRQLKKAEERMNLEQMILSKNREIRFNEILNEEQQELSKKCNLFVTRKGNKSIIEGDIDGHKVRFTADHSRGGFLPIDGNIDGLTISKHDTDEFLKKYGAIALFQTENSMKELKKIDPVIKEQAIKKTVDELLEL
jgi:hypothetical protein